MNLNVTQRNQFLHIIYFYNTKSVSSLRRYCPNTNIGLQTTVHNKITGMIV